LLFRWFVGLGMDDAVWNHAVFSKNRDRLLTSEVAQQFFAEVNLQAKRFMSDEHFTVERTNKTHESTTDADARLCHQPQSQMAGRERLRMAEADRPAPSGHNFLLLNTPQRS
jgi:transposase